MGDDGNNKSFGGNDAFVDNFDYNERKWFVLHRWEWGYWPAHHIQCILYIDESSHISIRKVDKMMLQSLMTLITMRESVKVVHTAAHKGHLSLDGGERGGGDIGL